MSFKYLFIGLLFLFFVACSTEAEPIRFGEDQCHHCKMNIVDRQHAAQFVTMKGKQYKFDAIECMYAFHKDFPTEKIAVALVSDYETRQMVDAYTSSYLISEKIKSPMGANLSAFYLKENAIEKQKEFLGTIYSWDELKSVDLKQ